MTKDVFYERRRDICALIIVVASVVCANLLLYAFSGTSIFSVNNYNSYTLQAKAWLSGRLDLGRNYTWLELAIYDGKYYVSFPPFPSVLMLPFTLFFGTNTPDNVLALVMACLSAAYAYRLARLFTGDVVKALFYSLFLTIGSNFLFLTFTGAVWFFAQVCAFSFTLMSFYYACPKEGGSRPALSLFFLCCAAGCRPFNLMFLPVILYLICKDKVGLGLWPLVKKLARWAVPALILGCGYMALNNARFGDVMEFGHNYLPEFIDAPQGQFSLSYFAGNFKTLWRLPAFTENGLRFERFNGTAFWLVSPIVLAYAVTYLRALARRFSNRGRERAEAAPLAPLLLPLLLSAFLCALCMHRTMGGWHFGHRYTVDVLPALFLGLLWQDKGGSRWAAALSVPLFILGFGINLVGTIIFYSL